MHFKDTQESVREYPSAPSQFALLAIGVTQDLENSALFGFRIIESGNGEDAIQRLNEDVALLILGSSLSAHAALHLLDRYAQDVPGNSALTIVLCSDSEFEIFQSHVSEGRIFYLARGGISNQHLRSIIACAGARVHAKREKLEDSLAARIAEKDELLEFCVRLPMQQDLGTAAALLIATAQELLRADKVQYLVYNADEETLTPADAIDNDERKHSAAAGLAAFVAHTGERVRLNCVGLDPRFDCEVDNPDGAKDVSFLAEPLVGPSSLPVGVITATKEGRSGTFSQEDSTLLQVLAECAAPTFNEIMLQSRIQAVLLKRAESASISGVFREEALQYHIRSWDQQGEVLKTLPSWLRTTYWIMLALVFVGLAGTLVGRINVYSRGPAVIRANSLASDRGYDVIAFLPESDATNLHPGMLMRLRIEQGPTFGPPIQIAHVEHDVMGPAEAERYAGKVDDPTFSITGRVIAVRAALPAGMREFAVPYRDVLTGEAEVSVRSESVIFAVIPGLRKIFGGAN
ncbi:MAG: GAF domain-containing protein [Candidatus Sulfotelmatobacter sp.]